MPDPLGAGDASHGAASLSPDKGSPVFLVDFADFLFSVDIRLVDAFRSSAAPVVAAGAEFTVHSAAAP